MRKLSLSVLLSVLISFALRSATNAQSNRSIPVSVIQQLLEQPAIPFGASRKLPADGIPRPNGMYSAENPPQDDAPINELFAYWSPRSRPSHITGPNHRPQCLSDFLPSVKPTRNYWHHC